MTIKKKKDEWNEWTQGDSKQRDKNLKEKPNENSRMENTISENELTKDWTLKKNWPLNLKTGQKELKKKKKRSVTDMWDSIKCSNTYVTGVLKGVEIDIGSEKNSRNKNPKFPKHGKKRNNSSRIK